MFIKVLALLAICATVASATNAVAPSLFRTDLSATHDISPLGIVSPTIRCGGVGTPIQLRISGCDGYCEFNPGQVHNIEMDFMPSSAALHLVLKCEICMNSGFCMQILLTTLPNSSIQPGFIYTAKYSIVPNDILAGQTVEFRGYLHNHNDLMEICIGALCDILIGTG